MNASTAFRRASFFSRASATRCARVAGNEIACLREANRIAAGGHRAVKQRFEAGEELKAGPQAALIDWEMVGALKAFGGIRIEDDIVVGRPEARPTENLTRDAGC